MDIGDENASAEKMDRTTEQMDNHILELLRLSIQKLSKENQILKDYLKRLSVVNSDVFLNEVEEEPFSEF